jgi:hypothetical protein
MGFMSRILRIGPVLRIDKINPADPKGSAGFCFIHCRFPHFFLAICVCMKMPPYWGSSPNNPVRVT